MTLRIGLIFSLALVPCFAQLAAPNERGVAMGHLHLTGKDGAAHRTFWTALGGKPVQNGNIQLIEFPNTYVMVRQAEPRGGPADTTVPYFTFKVKGLRAALAKWEAAGIKAEPGATDKLAWLMAPDQIKLELVNDDTLATPIAYSGMHINAADDAVVSAWYAKTFGAKVPGSSITVRKVAIAPAGTRGRANDHIGFEVKGLEAFIQNLEASGVKMDSPYRKIGNLSIAFFTDPWGTYIELTEGLAPAN
jgi:predicted enzyme related to lactoylglutathione lyase